MTNIGIAIIYLIKLTFMSGKSSKATSVANTSKAKVSPNVAEATVSATNQRRVVEIDEELYHFLMYIQHFVLEILNSRIRPFQDGYMILQNLLKKDIDFNNLLTVAYEFSESENPDIDYYKEVFQGIVGFEPLCDYYSSQMRFASTIVDLMSLVDCISQNIDHFKKEIEYLPQYSK